MSPFGVEHTPSEQQGARPARLPYTTAAAAGKRGNISSKLFDAPGDAFDDIDDLSDMEGMKFSNSGRRTDASAPAARDKTPGTQNLELSHIEKAERSNNRRGVRDLSFNEQPYTGESNSDQHNQQQQQQQPRDNTHASVSYRSYQVDTDAASTTTLIKNASSGQSGSTGVVAETPAYKPPPHPMQSSTASARWKHRGRLGLAKPKRGDSALLSDDNTQGADGDAPGMKATASSHDSLDFMSGLSSSINNKAYDRFTRSPPPVLSSSYAGSMDSESHRNSFLSMDEGSADMDNTFHLSRSRSKNQSVSSTGYAPMRGLQSMTGDMFAGSRSMDISDVSMNSNPKSRSPSPNPKSASKVSSNGGMAPRLMNVDEAGSAGKHSADPQAPDSAEYKGTSAMHGGDVERRREMSPLLSGQRRKMASPLASASASAENINQRAALSTSPRSSRISPNYPIKPMTMQEMRLAPHGESVVDMPARFQQYEKRINGDSPHYISLHERSRNQGNAPRSAESGAPLVDSNRSGTISPVYADQDLMIMPKAQHHQTLPSRSGNVGDDGQHPSSAFPQPVLRDGARPEYPGSGYSSPKQVPTRRPPAENNFEAFRKSSPILQQQQQQVETDNSANAAGLRSDDQNRLSRAETLVDDKAILQEQYLSARVLVSQKQHQLQPRQPRYTPPEISTHGYPTPQNSQLEPASASVSASKPLPQLHQQQQHQQHQQHQQQPAQASQPGMDPKRKLVINNREYQKISITGRGGSSKVYKAMSSKHEILAIKRVSFSRADMQSIAGYVNEIVLLRKFEGNPYIIQLYDAEINKERGLLHMVMELGDTDLANVLKRQGEVALGMNTIRLYWEQMLRAVQAIHDERVVHADLKPANYLLVKGSLKLIDFGIAKAIGNDTTNIHRENQIGTVNYMSPEAIKETNTDNGRRMMKLGRASDIWSLGIILYQMCYGRTPFAQLALFQKLASIPDPNFTIPFPKFMAGCQQVGTDKDPNADSNQNNSSGAEKFPVPLDLLRVMKNCLQRDPDRRMTIPDLLIDPLLCPRALDELLPPAMSQIMTLLKRNPQVLDQWDVSEAQNEKVLESLVQALHQQEQQK